MAPFILDNLNKQLTNQFQLWIKQMAKQEKLEKMVLKKPALSKAVTGVLTFQNHQVVHKYGKHVGPKGSIMMIPDEARRRRSRHGGPGNRSTKSLEPTSPTVSCMGQIKNKKHQQCIKRAKSKRITLPKNLHTRPLLRSVSEEVKNKKQTSTFRSIFRRRRSLSGRKSSFRASSEARESAVAAAPALSQMKSFASRRGALADFDWKAHVVVAPEEEDEEEDHETTISFSDPIVALRPKTEINLWKKRNMAPPPPLRFNSHQPAPI